MDKIKVLEQYLPPQCAPVIARWIDHFQCQFKVSRIRNTKLGDYRPPFAGEGHRIGSALRGDHTSFFRGRVDASSFNHASVISID